MLTLEKSMSALGKYVCLRWGSTCTSSVGVSICSGRAKVCVGKVSMPKFQTHTYSCKVCVGRRPLFAVMVC